MTEKSSNEYLIKLLNRGHSDALKPIIFENGFYINRLFGISFLIPEGQHIVGFNKFEETLRNQKLQGLYELRKDLLLDEPALLITKYNIESDEMDGIVTPTINFQIIPKDLNLTISLQDYANSINLNPEVNPYHMLKRFKVLKYGSVNEKNGYKFIMHETEYLFEHKELKEPVMVELNILNIDYGDFFLDFSMSQCKAQNETADDEFSQVLDSIKLNY